MERWKEIQRWEYVEIRQAKRLWCISAQLDKDNVYRYLWADAQNNILLREEADLRGRSPKYYKYEPQTTNHNELERDY